MIKLVTEYSDVGDARIAYRQNGTGPVLFLLHGNSASKKEFTKYQLDYFKDFNTIALDSRGHGETISTDTEYTFDKYSDDVIAFCASKQISNAYIIGYSDGGNLALHLAKKAPHIFKKIIAISPNYLADGLKEKFSNNLKKIMKVLSFLRQIGIPTKIIMMRFELMTNDIGLTEDDLKGINTSVKILYAENDLIKEQHIIKLACLIPESIVNKIMKSNHLTIFYKKETIECIREYLKAERAV